jgi:dTMP kinase
MFVTFEGIDGSGKTTQAALLAEWAAAEGHEIVAVREPGGTPLGERIRELLLDGPEMTAWAEAALFAAARGELAERVIRPALERGAWVVCDRYVDSALVYQGVARGLGVDAVFELNAIATGALLPELTFVLLLEPEESQRRRIGSPDRIESEDDAFVRRLDDGYRGLIEMFPERCIPLDASRPPDELAEEVREQLARSGAGAVRGQAPA